MYASQLTTNKSLSLSACRDIMALLEGLHLAAVMVDEQGCPQSSQSTDTGQEADKDSSVGDRQTIDMLIQPEGAGRWIDQGGRIEILPDQGKLFYRSSLRDDHYLVLPVYDETQQSGWLIVCLRGLVLEKTEALQRTCDRFGVDSESIYRGAMAQALSLEKTAGLISALVQYLMGRSWQISSQDSEIEALSRSLAQCYEELSLLHKMTDNMRLTQDMEQYFDQLVNHLGQVLECGKLMLFWNRRNNSCRAIEPENFLDQLPEVTHSGDLEFSDTQIQYFWDQARGIIERNQPYLIDSSVDGPLRYRWPEPVDNIIIMPIRLDSKVFGFWIALNKQTRSDFNSIDVKLLDLVSAELAVFLENRTLYDDMQELLLGSLGALTNSIDAKDPYTCGHSQRVAQISRGIAERAGMAAQQIDMIYLAGLLHDIGKIGVSERVLCKPGKLTDEEYREIKKHPKVGFNILKDIKQMSEVREIVLSHHERYDGRGYPRGLSGEDIPVLGRIVMLADSFDAMTSNRHYRNAMPLDMALAEIRRFSGTQFDPALADILLQPDMYEILAGYRQVVVG